MGDAAGDDNQLSYKEFASECAETFAKAEFSKLQRWTSLKTSGIVKKKTKMYKIVLASLFTIPETPELSFNFNMKDTCSKHCRNCIRWNAWKSRDATLKTALEALRTQITNFEENKIDSEQISSTIRSSTGILAVPQMDKEHKKQFTKIYKKEDSSRLLQFLRSSQLEWKKLSDKFHTEYNLLKGLIEEYNTYQEKIRNTCSELRYDDDNYRKEIATKMETMFKNAETMKTQISNHALRNTAVEFNLFRMGILSTLLTMTMTDPSQTETQSTDVEY